MLCKACLWGNSKTIGHTKEAVLEEVGASARCCAKVYDAEPVVQDRLDVQPLVPSRSKGASPPSTLVLSDSTSALDMAAEARVQDAIPTFMDKVTTLYVAQYIRSWR